MAQDHGKGPNQASPGITAALEYLYSYGVALRFLPTPPRPGFYPNRSLTSVILPNAGSTWLISTPLGHQGEGKHKHFNYTNENMAWI